MRILCVDDDQDSRYLVMTLLQGHGVDVQSAANGAEALEMLHAEPFDLIVSDILMPIMDGFQLCRKVRANEKLCHIPILIFTGTYTHPQDEALAIASGADRFVMKPCEPDVLVSVIMEMFAEKGCARDSVRVTANEDEVLLLYNDRLVRKLEEKMLELKHEVAARTNAEQEIRTQTERLQALVDILQKKYLSVGDLLDDVLEKMLHLTSSTQGYIALYDEKQQKLVLYNWSQEVMAQCAVKGHPRFFDLAQTGFWGEPIRQGTSLFLNDFQGDHPLKKGFPEGHVALRRFLTVPVYYNDKIVAVAGVANKPADYNETDSLNLTLFMEAVWKSVESMESSQALLRIEWLLDPSRPIGKTIEPMPYGDLTELNRQGLIRTSVGDAVLTDIVSDFLDLLETSAAIYEKNGDYALKFVASGWCRFLGAASHHLCQAGDNRQALTSGRWLCHESCWTSTCRLVVANGRAVDQECACGLRVYSVPIHAGGEIIGAICCCYGDPPKEPGRRKELADAFRVDESELEACLESYATRPPVIIDLAKRRLEVSARLIGEIVDRCQAEEALRESEMRYRTLFENSLDAVLLTAPDGRIVSANSSACRMFGRTEEELCALGREGVVDLTDPRLAALLEMRERYGVAAGELTYLRADGTPFPAEVSSVVFKDGQGNPRTSMIIHDISERKRAEVALRAERKRLEFVIQAAQIGAWEWNPQTDQFIVNENWAAMIGYTLKDLGTCNYETWARLVHPEDLQEVAAKVQRCLQGAADFYEVEFRMRHKNGEWRWIFDRGRVMTYDDAGKPLVLYGTHIDITEYRRAMEQLKQGEEFYRDLVDAQPGGIFRMRLLPGANGQTGNCFGFQLAVDMISPRFCEIIGLDRKTIESCPEEIIGRLHPDDRSSFRQMNKIAAENSRPFSWQGRLDGDGTVSWVSFESTPRPLENGEVLWTGILSDITVRKRAEQEQEQLRAQLAQAQKMESVGLLAGGVAHDFNNSLGVVLGYAEMALGKVDETSPLHEPLAEILNAARRSAEITRQLLAFARQQTIDPRAIVLNEIVGGVCKMLRRLIGENISLRWTPTSTPLVVWMDPSQVDQILVNLCVNAREAINGIGTIWVETDHVFIDQAVSATLPGSVPGDYAVLTVRDDGCGMDEETSERIFEPFFTTKELGQGTGLGLAIVYGIVKQNKGYILVDSHRDQGTTFKIFLPRDSNASIPCSLDTKGTSQATQGKTVLVVEDDPFIRKLVRQMLLELGYVALEARTPSEALAQLARCQGEIQILLADVIMPEMNGRDLAVRAEQQCPNIATVFMSGYTAGAVSCGGVLESGLVFLQKPFSVGELSEALQRAVAGKGR